MGKRWEGFYKIACYDDRAESEAKGEWRGQMVRKKRNKVCPKRVAEELAAIGFARATDCMYIEGNTLMFKPDQEISAESGAAIASVERTASGLKVKFYDKLKALELLGKYMGMFDGTQENTKQESNNLLEAILATTREEVAVGGLPELQQTADSGDDMVE